MPSGCIIVLHTVSENVFMAGRMCMKCTASVIFIFQVVTLLVGLCFFILSIVVAKQLNKHVSKLFEKE